MPIDYTHGSTGIYAFAANRAGAGQAARRDEEKEYERQLRLAQLAQQQQQFDATLGQRQEALDYGRDDQRRQRNFQAIRDIGQAAQQQQLLQAKQMQGGLDFQRQVALADLQQQYGQDDMVLQNELLQERDMSQLAGQREEQQFELAGEAAKQIDVEARAMLSQYRKTPLNPQGQQLLGEFSARIRRMQGQKESLRPDAYAQGMGQVLAEFDEAGLDDYVEQPPSIDSFRQQGQIQEEPDGSGWWTTEYRGGQVVPRFVPRPKNDAAKTVDPGDDPIDTLRGPMKRSDYSKHIDDSYKAARQRLIDEAKLKNPLAAKYDAPSRPAILKEMDEYEEAMRERMGGQSAEAVEFTSFQEVDQANHVGEFTIQGKRFFRDKNGQIGIADK